MTNCKPSIRHIFAKHSSSHEMLWKSKRRPYRSQCMVTSQTMCQTHSVLLRCFRFGGRHLRLMTDATLDVAVSELQAQFHTYSD